MSDTATQTETPQPEASQPETSQPEASQPETSQPVLVNPADYPHIQVPVQIGDEQVPRSLTDLVESHILRSDL